MLIIAEEHLQAEPLICWKYLVDTTALKLLRSNDQRY